MHKTMYCCSASCPQEEVVRIFREKKPNETSFLTLNNREELVTDIVRFLTAGFTMDPVREDK